MSKEFDAALEDVDDATNALNDILKPGITGDVFVPTIISLNLLRSARLLALAIRDTGLAADDDKWQPPTIEQALGPGG